MAFDLNRQYRFADFHKEGEGDTRPLHWLWALAKNAENVAIFLLFHFQFYSLFQEKCATLCCHFQTKHFKRRTSKFRCSYHHLGKSILLFHISNSKAQILHFSFLYHFLKNSIHLLPQSMPHYSDLPCKPFLLSMQWFLSAA